MKGRILVLDDEPSILEILGQFLSDEGYECTLCESALKALQILERQQFELLITDLKMPEMHGIEVVQHAKRKDRDMAVVVVTALLEVNSAIKALRVGADDYILKPFNLSEISVSVERALDRRRLVMENRSHQQELEVRVREATSDLEESNEELGATKEYLENLLNSSMDAIITVNNAGHISYANKGAREMLGYVDQEILGAPLERLVPKDASDVLRAIKLRLRKHERLRNEEAELLKKNGETIPVTMSISLVKSSEGAVVSTVAICKDITEQKRLEAELKEMSIKDSLTCLYNQRYFYTRLEAEIERAKRQGHPLSLLLFDIDQFKTYNDAHGHLDGDAVLQAAGHLVVECTRVHVDTGFRYGGDEFTVILPEAAEEQALTIAERIRTSFAEKHFDTLTLSIGLISYRKGDSLRSFIRFADAQMYSAKRSGGNRVYVYRSGQDPAEEDTIEEMPKTGHEPTQ